MHTSNSNHCTRTTAAVLSMDKPLTLAELAQIVGPRIENPNRGSVPQLIESWVRKGRYGVKLETWMAHSSEITTLKKYRDFRRAVSQARKAQAAKLYDYLRIKRNQNRKDLSVEQIKESSPATLQFSRN